MFTEWFPLSLIINPFGFELCVKSVTDTLRSQKGGQYECSSVYL